MKTIKTFFIIVLIAVSTGTIQTFAEKIQKSSEQNSTAESLQSIDKEIAAIESKINALKSKGLKNLSKEERIEFASLTDQLLTKQREKTALQKMILVEEKKKTQKAYDEVIETIKSIQETMSPSK